MSNIPERKNKEVSVATWIGMGIGVVIGSITNNIKLWVPVFVAAGACVGLVLHKLNAKNGTESSEENGENTEK